MYMYSECGTGIKNWLTLIAIAQCKSDNRYETNMNFIVLLIILLQVLTVFGRCYTFEGLTGLCKPLKDCNVDASHSLARCHNTGMHCCPTVLSIYSSTVAPTIATTSSTKVPSRVAAKKSPRGPKFPTECGWTPMNPRGQIVGDYIVEPDEYSWLASLLYGNGNSYRDCVGAVINSRYVLTAAHCLTSAALRIAGGL